MSMDIGDEKAEENRIVRNKFNIVLYGKWHQLRKSLKVILDTMNKSCMCIQTFECMVEN